MDLKDEKYDSEIENELRLRLEFKFNDIKNVLKNTLHIKNNVRWNDISQKTQYQYEAWEEIKKILDKELWMALPNNNLLKHNKWELKEKAVENILNIFNNDENRGRIRVTQSMITEIVRIIESAQTFKY